MAQALTYITVFLKKTLGSHPLLNIALHLTVCVKQKKNEFDTISVNAIFHCQVINLEPASDIYICFCDKCRPAY